MAWLCSLFLGFYEKMQVEFLNHACLKIRSDRICLLTDPWFSGAIFNDGWRLLYEFSDAEIKIALADVTHIWISHEHPDHFSVPFFKEYKEVIQANKVTVLFQRTEDRRVYKFLTSLGVSVLEMRNFKIMELDKGHTLTCGKVGLYDSCLYGTFNGESFLNLNDCDVRSNAAVRALKRRLGSGKINYLFSQFSYAAWKGGPTDVGWRQRAAKEKLNALAVQAKEFDVDLVVPFASFSYFSRPKNWYLNDCVNRPEVVLEVAEITEKVMLPKPFSTVVPPDFKQNQNAILFWRRSYEKIHRDGPFVGEKIVETIDAGGLKHKFESLISGHSLALIWLCKLVSWGYLFGDVVVHCEDSRNTFKFVLSRKGVIVRYDTDFDWDISMRSSDLLLLCSVPYGLDTLSVNGCFDGDINGFKRLVRLFGLASLEGVGLRLTFSELPRILTSRFLWQRFIRLVEL